MKGYRDDGIERRGQWFALVRPNGRFSCLVWRSPYRAAKHGLDAYGVATWPELRHQGFRVVCVDAEVERALG
jgi:hypothetical protein